ncbi:hypothetical protein BUPH_08339 (plasmid) [Paraburkholderia phenoliruptrix BR3459a]|nr:hypothetical protein BUPH_08339 [Paraburkholderia phenoliruptrix BR3459a]
MTDITASAVRTNPIMSGLLTGPRHSSIALRASGRTNNSPVATIVTENIWPPKKGHPGASFDVPRMAERRTTLGRFQAKKGSCQVNA